MVLSAAAAAAIAVASSAFGGKNKVGLVIIVGGRQNDNRIYIAKTEHKIRPDSQTDLPLSLSLSLCLSLSPSVWPSQAQR